MPRMNIVGKALLGVAIATSTVVSCAPRQQVKVVLTAKEVAEPTSYVEKLLKGRKQGTVEVAFWEAVQKVKELAEQAKTLSAQRVSPARRVGPFQKPRVLIEKLYKSEDLFLRGLGVVGYAVLGDKEKVDEALLDALGRGSSEEERLYKLSVIEAAKVVNTREAAYYVAQFLLKEEDEGVRNAATVALLNMEYGYAAVKELIAKDPSRIGAFKDLYTLFYLNAPKEKRRAIAEEVLSLGVEMAGKASLQDYKRWWELLSLSGIAYDFPASTFATLKELLGRNPFGAFKEDRVAFSQLIGEAYTKVMTRVVTTSLSELAREDIAKAEVGEGILDIPVVIAKAALLREEKAYGKAFALLKPHLQEFLKMVEVDENGRPRYLSRYRKDGQAAFFLAMAAHAFYLADHLPYDVKEREVMVDKARNSWATLVKYIEGYPRSWEAAMLYGAMIGAPIYDYAIGNVEDPERGVVAAKAIANLAIYAGTVSAGSLTNYILKSGAKGEVMDWLGIALGHAIYYEGLTEAGKPIPEPFGTRLPAFSGLAGALKKTYLDVVDRLMEEDAPEGALHVLWALAMVDREIKLEPFGKVMDALKGRKLLTNETARYAFLLAVREGADEMAVASLKALVEKGSYQLISSAATDVIAYFGRKAVRDGREVFQLAQPLGELGELISYIETLSNDPTMPPAVRGTLKNLAAFLRGEEVYALGPSKGRNSIGFASLPERREGVDALWLG